MPLITFPDGNSRAYDGPVTGADVVDCDYAEAYGEPARLRPRVSCTPEQLGTRTPGRDRALIRRGSRIVTKIVRRELFAAYGVRFPEGLAYEDNALATVWCLASRIEKVAEPLYFYRVNLQSTVRSRNSSAVFDRLQTSETMLQNSRDWGLYEPYRDEIDADATRVIEVLPTAAPPVTAEPAIVHEDPDEVFSPASGAEPSPEADAELASAPPADPEPRQLDTAYTDPIGALHEIFAANETATA